MDRLPSRASIPWMVTSVSRKWARLVCLGWTLTSMNSNSERLISRGDPWFLSPSFWGRQVYLCGVFLPTPKATSDRGSWCSAPRTSWPGGFSSGTPCGAPQVSPGPPAPTRQVPCRPLPGYSKQGISRHCRVPWEPDHPQLPPEGLRGTEGDFLDERGMGRGGKAGTVCERGDCGGGRLRGRR